MCPKSRGTETGMLWSHIQAEKTSGSQYMCFRLNPVGRQTCCSSSSQSQAPFKPHGSDHVDSAGEDTSLSPLAQGLFPGVQSGWLMATPVTWGQFGFFFFFSLKSWNLNQPETPHNCTSQQHPRKASPGEQNSLVPTHPPQPGG